MFTSMFFQDPEIEKRTGAFISVFGKTVSIIAKIEEMEKAEKAVEMLLGGAKHSTAFKYLGKKEEKKEFRL